MKPPKCDDAADPGKARHRDYRKGNEHAQHTPHVGDDQSAQPFVLVIYAGDRSTVWGYYATHAEGEAIARRLRVHGFHAVTSDTREVQR